MEPDTLLHIFGGTLARGAGFIPQKTQGSIQGEPPYSRGHAEFTWRGKDELSTLAGRERRLRFVRKNADPCS